MFNLGQWVIDTKKQDTVEVVTILEGGTETVYVLKDNNNDLYITGESNLISYDKYYFGEQEE